LREDFSTQPTNKISNFYYYYFKETQESLEHSKAKSCSVAAASGRQMLFKKLLFF